MYANVCVICCGGHTFGTSFYAWCRWVWPLSQLNVRWLLQTRIDHLLVVIQCDVADIVAGMRAVVVVAAAVLIVAQVMIER